MNTLKCYYSILAFSFLCLFCSANVIADPLPSWREGPARQAILNFVSRTTDKSSPECVPLQERIAVFDQDGTLWVEQPIYTQIIYCFDRVKAMAAAKPELAKTEPFKTVLSGNREEIAKLSSADRQKIALAAFTGMSTLQFQNEVRNWSATAKDQRWKRPFTELSYQPMQEVINYLQQNGYKTYIVTGGGLYFVRAFSEQLYGIPPDQIIGSATAIKYEYDTEGQPFFMKEPKLLLNNNFAGKPENIDLIIGRRPYAAFGNSTGDQQMLEYTQAGSGARLSMLVLHDDPIREYAYGPAQGLPDTKVGTFTQKLYDEAKNNGWIVISMKDDWKQIFSFEQPCVEP